MLLKQASIYLLIGVFNTLLGLSIIYATMYFLSLHYLVSNIMGYIIPLIFSFFLNRHFTFNVKDKPHVRIVLFFLVFIIAFSVQFLLVFFLKTAAGLNPYICQLFGVIFYTSIGFFLNKGFTFRRIK